jgi:two-component system, OmpR family, sensor histidine kinase BaeS
MQAKLEAMEDGVVPLSLYEVGRLGQQTQLLARLVDDLRTLSLAEAGRLSLQLRPVALGQAVEQITAAFVEQAQAKGMVLQCQVDHHLQQIEADPDRLAQMLGNLIDNAIRYSSSGSTVVITQSAKAITVSDNGPGLSHEALLHVFDRFYRAESSRNRSAGGSGLGLAIVKAVAEAHGWQVRAANASAGGAVFSIEMGQGAT